MLVSWRYITHIVLVLFLIAMQCWTFCKNNIMDDHILIMRTACYFAWKKRKKTVVHATKVGMKSTFCIIAFSSCSYQYEYITEYNAYLKTIVGCYLVLVNVIRAQIHRANMCASEWRIERKLGLGIFQVIIRLTLPYTIVCNVLGVWHIHSIVSVHLYVLVNLF